MALSFLILPLSIPLYSFSSVRILSIMSEQSTDSGAGLGIVLDQEQSPINEQSPISSDPTPATPQPVVQMKSVRLKSQLISPLSSIHDKPPNRPKDDRFFMTPEESDIVNHYPYITMVMRTHMIRKNPDGTLEWTDEPYLVLGVSHANVEVEDYPKEWAGLKVYVDIAGGAWTYHPL